jgi:hypothetical protein
MRLNARLLCVVPHNPGQPGVMRPSGVTQVISTTTIAAPPSRARAQVHQVEVPGTPSTAL